MAADLPLNHHYSLHQDATAVASTSAVASPSDPVLTRRLTHCVRPSGDVLRGAMLRRLKLVNGSAHFSRFGRWRLSKLPPSLKDMPSSKWRWRGGWMLQLFCCFFLRQIKKIWWIALAVWLSCDFLFDVVPPKRILVSILSPNIRGVSTEQTRPLVASSTDNRIEAVEWPTTFRPLLNPRQSIHTSINWEITR